MIYLEVIAAAVVLFAVGAVVAVRRRELSDPGRDTTDTRVPPTQTRMAPGDIDALRFGLAFRGYRMDQVDDALDRLRDELRARDERISELEQSTSAAGRPRAWTAPAEAEPLTAPLPDEVPIGAGVLTSPVAAEAPALDDTAVSEPVGAGPAEEPAGDLADQEMDDEERAHAELADDEMVGAEPADDETVAGEPADDEMLGAEPADDETVAPERSVDEPVAERLPADDPEAADAFAPAPIADLSTGPTPDPAPADPAAATAPAETNGAGISKLRRAKPADK